MELQKIFVSLALKIDDYKQGLRQAADHAEDMRGKVGKTFDNLLGKAKLAAAGVGLAIAAGFGMAVASSIEVNAQLETTQLQFETLMGSADQAKEHVEGLFKFAEQTPFETGPIIDASLKLQTFGGAALNTQENIRLLGDAAAATNSPIDELGFWVGRLYGNLQAGQPFGEAAMRLQELAVMSPQARTEMERLQHAGASAQEVFAYFQKDLTKFTGAMDEQASTWKGMVSTVKDQISLLMADTLRPFFDEGKEGLAAIIGKLNDPDIVNGIKAMGDELAKVAGILGDVLGGALDVMASIGQDTANKDLMEQLGFSSREMEAFYNQIAKQEEVGLFLNSEEDLRLALAVNEALQEQYAATIAIVEAQNTRADAYAEQQEAIQTYHENLPALLDAELAGWAAIVQAQEPAVALTTQYAADLTVWGENAGIAQHQAMEFGRALGYDAEQAALAAAETQKFAEAFQSVIGDFTKDLPGADKPLVNPAGFVSLLTGGLDAEHLTLLDEYKSRVEKLSAEVFNLENGIGTYGMEQEKVNEKIAAARGELAYYSELMAPLAAVTGDVRTEHHGLSVNVGAVKQAIFEQLVQMGAAPEVITTYGVAIGVMSEAQAEAALKAAAVKVKIEELATAIAGGMPVEKALADLDSFIFKLENGITPAAEAAALNVPQRIVEMKERIGEEALASGQALGDGLDQGIAETMPVALATAETAAEDVISATKGIYGVESPSTVFHGIGADLMQGLTDGINSLVIGVVNRVKAIGGQVIDGIIAGINDGKERLRGVLSGVADLIPDWLKQFLGIASPARAMVPIGEAIVEGIIEGIEDKGGDLLESIEALMNNAKRAADLTAAFSGVYYKQLISPIDEEIKVLEEGLKNIAVQRRGLNPVLEDVLAGFGINANDPLAELQLRRIRDMATYGSDMWGQAELGLNLLAERSKLTAEDLALQAKLAEAEERRAEAQERMLELEEKRQQLDFLQAQFDLLRLMKDNDLSFSLLGGIRLGADASPLALMEVMGIVMEQLVDKASEELFAITASATPAENAPTPGLDDERSVTNINTQNIHGGQHIYITEPDESELAALMEYLV